MAKGDFGFNGKIGSVGIGTRRIRVMDLTMKMSIIASADSSARVRRAFYPVVTTSSSFDMTVGFISYRERSDFVSWMDAYLKSLADGTARSSSMTVSIPNRDFLKTCVFRGDLEYGEGSRDVGYLLSMPFAGASDPVALDLGARQAGISYFQRPDTGWGRSKNFYPTGVQVSGAGDLEGVKYDTDVPPGIRRPGDGTPGPNDTASGPLPPRYS